MYVIVWQFVAKPGREAEFEAAYGPRGRWVEFFRAGEGYVSTELWRGDGSWITVDRWRSREDHQRFRSERLAEYEALDREMEYLTAKETNLGAFTAV
jgi:heme-degrading monooxygenase HmoA